MSKAKMQPIAYTMTPDANVVGLSVRTMKATGVSSYVFYGRVKGSKQKRSVTIGRTDNWKLKAARERARELAVDYNKGIDPAPMLWQPQKPRQPKRRVSRANATPTLCGPSGTLISRRTKTVGASVTCTITKRWRTRAG